MVDITTFCEYSPYKRGVTTPPPPPDLHPPCVFGYSIYRSARMYSNNHMPRQGNILPENSNIYQVVNWTRKLRIGAMLCVGPCSNLADFTTFDFISCWLVWRKVRPIRRDYVRGNRILRMPVRSARWSFVNSLCPEGFSC